MPGIKRMNKDDFIDEVEKRLNRIFKASKDGYKVSPVDRHCQLRNEDPQGQRLPMRPGHKP